MATLIQDPRQPHSWSTPNLNGNGFTTASAPNPNQRYSYAPHPSRATQNTPPMNVNGGSTAYDSLPTLPPHNEVEMTREMLVHVLEHFSTLLPKYFDWKIVQGMVIPPSQGMRFVVHGGACMLLHEGLYALSVQQQTASPSLATRTKTRDIDYIHRGFIAEYGQNRFPDAAERLKACIQETARKFGLGADWMNSDADIALPMAHDPTGKLYDPIYTVSITPQNMNLHTIYKSSNGFLTLVSVTPFWAVALKLVRYTKWDPVDICLLLRNGTILSGTQWTAETLEGWLFNECWAMGYINFDARKKAEMRSRIEHAIQTLATWNHYVGSSPPDRGRNGDLTGSSRRSGEYDRDRDRGRAQDRNRISRDMDPPLSAHDVMGGGAAAVGGQFASQHGWKYSFNGTPQGSNAAVVFPQTGAAANGVPPAVPPGQLLWGNPNERAKSKSRSKSKSRNASRVASRKNSPEQEEFFIPPEIDSDAEDDYGAYYGQSQGTRQNGATQRAYEHSSPWANPNIASTNIPASHSHLANSNGVSQPGGASGPSATWRPPPAKNPGGSRVDPYGMRSLDQAINSVQYDPIYSSPQEYGNRLPDYNSLASGSGFQPVIPVIPPDTQAHQRKKKDKQRHVERRRARSSKWGYASESESEESEGYWDDDEHNKENRIRDIRERSQRDQQDALGRKRAQQGGPWHNLHVPAVGGRSNSGSQSQIPPVQPQRLHSQQDPSRQYMASYGGLPQDASSSMLNAGRKSRPGSRNPSPNPDTKRRPPPLDLTPPPVIAGLPQMRGSNQPVIPAMPPPSFADPALLAQYQFEQQKLDYQREREQHQQLVERERAFYQQRQFKQVPAHHSQMMEQQRQQQLMYQQQQQQYQLQQQQQAQQQQRPQYMYQHQQQMQQRQYR